ncbi:MAG: hypothetical protein ACFFFG_17255 [Candidatus Thorarchaeota archaeon]
MQKIRFILNESRFIFKTIRGQTSFLIILLVLVQVTYLILFARIPSSSELEPVFIGYIPVYAMMAASSSTIILGMEKADKVTEQIFMAPMSKLEVVFYRFVAMTPIILTVVFVFVFVNYISTILFVGFLDPFFVVSILGMALILALPLNYLTYYASLILSQKYLSFMFTFAIMIFFLLPSMFMEATEPVTLQMILAPIIATSILLGIIGFITTLALKKGLVERIVVTSV